MQGFLIASLPVDYLCSSARDYPEEKGLVNIEFVSYVWITNPMSERRGSQIRTSACEYFCKFEGAGVAKRMPFFLIPHLFNFVLFIKVFKKRKKLQL
ncbi:MAG TPA: hypothetical protein PLK12_04335 [Prolixibacteraceae bacterium]|nr:hypothetical protein [Prolixibacteraceae bacterium]